MPYTQKYLDSLTPEEREDLPPDINYDALWKDHVEHDLPEFVAFTLSELYKDVDWDVPVKFLEQEIPEIIEASKAVRKKQTDKLAELTLKDGTKRLLLYHIEFEGSGKPIITFRLFDYRFLIYSRFKTHLITAIVIYTGSKYPKIYDHYELKGYGTSLRYQFNTYIIANQKEEDLLTNPNSFAIIVLANLYVLKSKKDMGLRMEYKKKLMLEI